MWTSLAASPLTRPLTGVLAATLLVLAAAPALAQDTYLAKARKAYDERRYDAAIIHYTMHLRENDRDYAAFNMRGNSYFSKGEYDSAINDYTRAVGIKPDYAIAYANRGYVYCNKGKYGEAIGDATTAAQLEPDLAHAYYVRGITHERKQDWPNCFRDMTRVVELDPDHKAARESRRYAASKTGNTQAVLDDLTALIRLAPTDASHYQQRARTRAECRDYKGALSDYVRALELDPSARYVHEEVARLQAKLGRYSEAKVSLLKAVPPPSLSAVDFATRSWYHYCAGAYYEAAGDARQCLLLDSANECGHMNLAQALFRTGDTAAIRSSCERGAFALRVDPKNSDRVALLLGVQELARGDAVGAIDYFSRGIRGDSSSLADLYDLRGDAYWRTGRPELAKHDWAKADSLDPRLAICASERRASGGDVSHSLDSRPDLTLLATELGGQSTWLGGTKVGFVVTAENTGKGKADVDIVLSGDEYLLKLFGSKRSIGEVGPGQTRSETFTVDLPASPPEHDAVLYVELAEKSIGASPLKKEAIRVALVKGTAPEPELPPEPVLPAPSAFDRAREDGYALIVGMSTYQHAKAPKYSKSDAEMFALYARRVLGVANIKTAYDDQATASTIRGNLTDWLKKKHGFKVIYFAGHGVPDPENPRSGGVCALPYDGDPELRSTLIPVSDLAELGANEDDSVVVFIDACYSGEGRTVELASRPLVLAEIPETKAITFAAAEGSQPSKEFDKAQHGYFTYYTLLGLKGKADTNNDGWITTTELYDYVKKNVSDATNEVQVPVLRPEREIRLGRIR